MKKTTVLRNSVLCAAVFAAALFISCGQKKNMAVREYAVSNTAGAAPRMAKSMMQADSVSFAGAEMDEAVYEDRTAEGGGAAEQERKLIKTGSVTLEVQSLSAADSAVEKWSASLGGYISNSYSHQTGANYTVKIPAARFDEAMKTAGDLGILREHSISTQDVSEQFYDLQTRLSNKRVMRDNLRAYLEKAKDIKDLLQIEKELNSVLTEIESMEGRMKRLSNQIDYATITVSVQLPYGKTESGFSFPDAGEGFRKFISNTVAFFAKCLVCFFYIIICGIPVLAVISFLYWLLWGKVALLKKLYHRLSK